MDIKRFQHLLYPLIVSLATAFVLFFIMQKQHKKLAVVDAVRLFNEYQMKKEMESREGQALKVYEQQLDSLETTFKVLANSNTEEARKVAGAYQALKSKVEGEYASSNQAINEQVWKRLNPLVEQFGREQGLHVILGANGMGSILYNDDFYDLTDDLIKYVNLQYENRN